MPALADAGDDDASGDVADDFDGPGEGTGQAIVKGLFERFKTASFGLYRAFCRLEHAVFNEVYRSSDHEVALDLFTFQVHPAVFPNCEQRRPPATNG
ncbi:hypothetical protein ACVIEM_001134 [Rhizobium leguminosarum]